MGGINIKLMQGIEEAENQVQKEKQPQKVEESTRKEKDTKDAKETVGKPKKVEKQKNTSMRKKAVIEPDRMSKKQIFSFRAVVADITIWRAYAIAKGETVENLGNAAMEEYLKRHKLSGTEQAIFEALKARGGIGKK